MNDQPKTEPRKFNLYFHGLNEPPLVEAAADGKLNHANEKIEVIEYNAFEELKAEMQKLIKAHDDKVTTLKEFQKLFVQVKPELESLSKQITILAEAMSRIKEVVGTSTLQWHIADQALSACEAMNCRVES